MTMQNQSTGSADPATSAVADPLALSTPLSPAEILAKLDAAARRGKLAGFTVSPKRAPAGTLFEVEAYAVPFDGRLLCRAEAGASSTTLVFSKEVFRKMPLIWLVVLVVTIWPGLPLTENLIAQICPDGWWRYTAWWYLPMTVPALPLGMWQAWRRSQVMMRASAAEMVENIANILAAPAAAVATPDPKPPAAAPNSAPI